MGQQASGVVGTVLFDFELFSMTSNYMQAKKDYCRAQSDVWPGKASAHHQKQAENSRLKIFAFGVIFHLPNCSCFVLFLPMSSTLYQDPSLIIPQRPVRVRFQARRAGIEKARSAMRDFTLLLALAWGAAEVALWLGAG